MGKVPDHSVVCEECGGVVEVALPDFGFEIFNCDCGWNVVIERGKNKYEITHTNSGGQVVAQRTHYINKKKEGKE